MANAALDLRDRDGLFDALAARTFDLVVIGGGITGAGIARDAALRGLSVALLEMGDFASGTSSRSSKLIHGGLRYLALGDLALVREAASERKVVRAIAPHLARETPFILPARSPGAVAKLRAALWTFEKLGGVAKGNRHQLWSQADLAAREPAMRSEGLAGAVVYPEYVTNDSRLTVANIRSAAAAGATVANYARVEKLVLDGGRATAVEISDQTFGGEHRRTRVWGQLIINAAGPWVDSVRALEAGGASIRLALSRGIHLVVSHERAPVRRTLVLPAADRRSIFAVPAGAVTYIGTTDEIEGQAEVWPAVTSSDAHYLLTAANAGLSGPGLNFDDVTAAWSGLRPLVAEAGKSASEISRRDELWTGPAGVLSIAGGKLTAYRQMAERVVDKAVELLGRKAGACVTAKQSLVGGEVSPDKVGAQLRASGLAQLPADRLVGLYGSEAPGVAGGAQAEAAFAVLNEGALTLEDYWVRRGARAWFDADGGLAALEPAASAMAPLLGWSQGRRRSEIEGCRKRRAADLTELSATA